MLEESKRLGFLGPGPISDHIDHAHRFLPPLDDLSSQSSSVGGAGGLRFVDLGAGGGLPSLPILVARPSYSAVLLDAIQKRCSFLVWAAGRLGIANRVDVWSGRAEEIGHEDRARFGFDAVVARGFGPPASTVECGAPLLRPGGRLVISEPPEEREWPAEPLASIGLVLETEQSGGRPGGVVVLRRGEEIATIADHYPRRIKVQQRTPLF